MVVILKSVTVTQLPAHNPILLPTTEINPSVLFSTSMVLPTRIQSKLTISLTFGHQASPSYSLAPKTTAAKSSVVSAKASVSLQLKTSFALSDYKIMTPLFNAEINSSTSHAEPSSVLSSVYNYDTSERINSSLSTFTSTTSSPAIALDIVLDELVITNCRRVDQNIRK